MTAKKKTPRKLKPGSRTVHGVRLSCDRWPDTNDLRACITDIFRLEGARTGEEKALALWNWLLRLYHRGNYDQEGDPGFEGYLLDTLKALNVHGFHYCDGWGRLAVNLWQAAGGRARKIVCRDMGHTVYELFYKDADGKSRWHVFDAQNGWYVRTRDGSRVASMEELDRDPSLITDPVERSVPWFHHLRSWKRCSPREFFSANWTVSVSPKPRHKMQVSLRPGETLTRFWDCRGTPYLPGNGPAGAYDTIHVRHPETGELRDAVNEPYYHNYYLKRRKITDRDGKVIGYEPVPQRTPLGGDVVQGLTYGTVAQTYEVPLTGGRHAEGTARPPYNVASEPSPSREVASVHPLQKRKIAQLYYEIKLPYLLTDGGVDAVIRPGKHRLDVVSFALSTDDGDTWHNVFGSVFGKEKGGIKGGSARPVHFTFGAAERAAGKFSVYGKYRFLLRIDMCACGDPRQVGLDRLRVFAGGICNMFSLPMLQPGRNVVRLRGTKAPAGSKVKVTYKLDDAKRKNRRVEKVLPARGGSFVVNVAGKKPTDVRMREISLASLL